MYWGLPCGFICPQKGWVFSVRYGERSTRGREDPGHERPDSYTEKLRPFEEKLTRCRHFVENVLQDIFISSSRSQSLLNSPPLLTSALVGSRGWGPCLSLTCSFPSACQCEMEVKVAIPAPVESWIGFWGLRGPEARHFSKDKVPVSWCPPLLFC